MNALNRHTQTDILTDTHRQTYLQTHRHKDSSLQPDHNRQVYHPVGRDVKPIARGWCIVINSDSLHWMQVNGRCWLQRDGQTDKQMDIVVT